MSVSISLVPVLVASLLSFILGWIWYSPLLFGNVWMKEMGMKKPDKMDAKMKSKMMNSMCFGFLFTLLTSYVFAHFLYYMDVNTFNGVAQLSVWLWLGFMLPVIMTGYLWENKTLLLVAISGGQTLASLMLAGMVIISMN